MNKVIKSLMALLFVIFSASQLGAATFKINVDSLTFNAGDKQDVMGPASAAADGKYDASFTLKLSWAHAIKDIELKNETTGKAWSSSPSSAAGLLLVKDAAGKILNASVTMVMSNGRVLEASTAKTGGQSAPNVTKADRAVKFLSSKPAVINIDLVGKSKKRAPDGGKDTYINIEITGRGKIVAMTVTGTSGGWDTLTSNNGRWLLGVSEGTKLLNSANGTVALQINGTKKYRLFMQDNGALLKKNGKLTLSVTWKDGQVTQSTLIW